MVPLVERLPRHTVTFPLLCLAMLVVIYFSGLDYVQRSLKYWIFDSNVTLSQPVNMYDFELGNSQSQLPLNITALQKNFPLVKEATKPFTNAAYRKNINRMMKNYVPVFNTTSWRLHSESGKNYALFQLQQEFIGSMKPGFKVPNIAHIILPFVDTQIKFYQMVGILSCLHVMKPDRLLLWYAAGKHPCGEWWEKLKKNFTDAEWEEKIIMAQRPIPTTVYTVPVHVREHQSDVMRMEALLTFGGFYMDLDVFVLKSLEPLRKFSCTIGREISYGLCNGILLSAPNSTFLAMWYPTYQVFDDALWGDHSVKLPHEMQKLFPDLCHVEEESMDRPNWTPEEVKWIYGIGQQANWNWRAKNYAMHLWYDKYGVDHDMESIKTLNSMFGEMCRYILYGN